MFKRGVLFLMVAAMFVVSLTACGVVGRYNNKPSAMSWPTNTTYYYSTKGNLVGSSVSYK